MTKRCIKNTQCSSGYCNINTNECADTLLAGYPCNGDKWCTKGTVCHPQGKRCVPQGRAVSLPCFADYDCSSDEFCEKGKCQVLLKKGESCSHRAQCKEGLICDGREGLCVERCVKGLYDCPPDHHCVFDSFCASSAIGTGNGGGGHLPPPSKPVKDSSLPLTLICVGSVLSVLVVALLIFIAWRRHRNLRAPDQPPSYAK